MREIESISLEEELGKFHLSWGGGYETVDEEVGVTPRFEEEDDSFVDINDTPGTKSNQRVGLEGLVWVEVVAASGRRARCRVRPMILRSRPGWSSNRGRSTSQSNTLILICSLFHSQLWPGESLRTSNGRGAAVTYPVHTNTDQTTASTIHQPRLGHGYFKSFLTRLPAYDST